MGTPNTYCPYCYASDPDILDSGYCEFCGEKLVLPLIRGKVCAACGHWYGRDDFLSCDDCHPIPLYTEPPTGPESEGE